MIQVKTAVIATKRKLNHKQPWPVGELKNRNRGEGPKSRRIKSKDWWAIKNVTTSPRASGLQQ
jgi:hypothetical protein